MNIRKLCANYQKEKCVFKVENFRRFLTFVAKYFPNIQILNIDLDVWEWDYQDALEVFKSMNADVFKDIPSSVKGYMEFNRSSTDSFDTVVSIYFHLIKMIQRFLVF